MKLMQLSLMIILLVCTNISKALDSYVIDHAQGETDRRKERTLFLLRKALDASVALYGPYSIGYTGEALQRQRLLRKMIEGNEINVSVQPTRPEWEQHLIPIRIPIDKGLAGYRISLINGNRQKEFSEITSLNQLRKQTIGVGMQWTTVNVYRRNGFEVVEGPSYEGLFAMLHVGRFDLFPRTIEEVILEKDEWKNKYPALKIEESFVMYTSLPRYFFVSPKTPRLAERLQAGLEILISNGEFDRMFIEYYGPMIASVNLCQRKIFQVNNSELSEETPLQNKSLWFDPFTAGESEAGCVKKAPEK